MDRPALLPDGKRGFRVSLALWAALTPSVPPLAGRLFRPALLPEGKRGFRAGQPNGRALCPAVPDAKRKGAKTRADNDVLTLQEPDEEYAPIDVKDLDKEPVKLGRQGENETQTVKIDCNDWLVALQGCTFMVVAKRPGESELYVPDVTVSNGMITWPIKAQDTALAGTGRAEVRALKGGAAQIFDMS